MKERARQVVWTDGQGDRGLSSAGDEGWPFQSAASRLSLWWCAGEDGRAGQVLALTRKSLGLQRQNTEFHAGTRPSSLRELGQFTSLSLSFLISQAAIIKECRLHAMAVWMTQVTHEKYLVRYLVHYQILLY